MTGGHVIDSIHACFWFLLKFDNYRDTVVSIINKGHDTDTSAAIVGGLAGIYYGVENIPSHWVAQIARREDIEALCEALNERYF